jgi:hypothetical protein
LWPALIALGCRAVIEVAFFFAFALIAFRFIVGLSFLASAATLATFRFYYRAELNRTFVTFG